MPTSTTSAAALVPELIASILVQPLEAESIFLSSGPTLFDTSAPLSVPRLTGSEAPEFVAENGLIPDVDITFDDLKLMPTSRKGLKSISRISNESLRASSIALDAAVQARIVGDNARVLDNALLNGTGTSDTIKGILNQTGILTDDLSLTDYDSFFDAVGTWMSEFVDPARGQWLIHPLDWTTVRKTKDGNERYLVQANPAVGAQRTIDGIPVRITSRIAQGTVALVDFGLVAVARDLAASVTVLTERYAEYDQVGIRCVSRYDVGLLHPEGVLRLTTPPPEEP